jgi:hypothetical protein
VLFAYVILCLAAFAALVAILRIDRISLGLPIAYLALLLLNHVPGAYAHVIDHDLLPGQDLIELGMRFTTTGVIAFVIGVLLARQLTSRPSYMMPNARPRFWTFCLVGGWVFVYGLNPLRSVPSLGAAIYNGAAIWLLGVGLGLRYAVDQTHLKSIIRWCLALSVFPTTMLVLGGFMSYGTAAVVTVLSILAVSARTSWRAFAGIIFVSVFALNVFVNYFESRNQIRNVAWSNSSVSERIDVNLKWIRNFHILDLNNREDLLALDERLNQNYFIGVAARRLDLHHVDYLHGRSVSDAVIALVPRAIWPGKPVYGGSPEIVRKMTGLELNQDTSWGVGQIMEFEINFGIVGVVIGMLVLGGLIGWIDARAAAAEVQGRLDSAILYFLPGAALLQPIGSLVELSGSSAAALVAAFAWRWAWRRLARNTAESPPQQAPALGRRSAAVR